MSKQNDLEKIFVSMLVKYPNNMDFVKSIVKNKKYFVDVELGEIYDAMLEMQTQGKVIDRITLTNYLSNKNKANLMQKIDLSIDNDFYIEEYAKTIADTYYRRLLAEKLQKVNITDISKYPSTCDIITELIKIADDFRQTLPDQGENFKDLITKQKERFEAKLTGKENLRVIQTGLAELDSILAGRGMREGDFVVIAARPGMGKTTLALNIINKACKEGKAAILFSQDMPSEDLIDVMVSNLAAINVEDIITGNITEEEYFRVMDAYDTIYNFNFEIVQNCTDFYEIVSYVKKKEMEWGHVDLVIMDYIQQFTHRDYIRAGKNVMLGELAQSLKRFALNAKTRVIALSQLNRDIERREDKRPVMADLYETGYLEAAADKIIFIHRDEQYNPEKKDKAGIAELWVRKNRGGRIGMCQVAFIGKYSTFANLYEMDLYLDVDEVGDAEEIFETAQKKKESEQITLGDITH